MSAILGPALDADRRAEATKYDIPPPHHMKHTLDVIGAAPLRTHEDIVDLIKALEERLQAAHCQFAEFDLSEVVGFVGDARLAMADVYAVPVPAEDPRDEFDYQD